MSRHYHYIITGAGLAGHSLLLHMMQQSFFRNKKILVIDASPKNQNDRTWCFWEKQTGIFEPVVHHRWNHIDFFSDDYSATLPISPYQYKMIQAKDLYRFVQEKAADFSNIEWRYEEIKAVRNGDNCAMAETETETFSADYIFNSIRFTDELEQPAEKNQSGYHLLQHFKGWVIETEKPVFDDTKARFMDFRISQENGTAFFYVLPTSPTKTLVEYTLFTKELLPPAAYNESLKKYISENLCISDYHIEHEEFGIIPMTDFRFPLQQGRVVYTGIAGGQAKGSSGYVFQFVQKRAAQIVAGLVKTERVALKRSFADRKFHLYDSVLLNVLYKNKIGGADIFSKIFLHNPPQRVFRFLDNESSIWEDLQIMRSVPTGIFLPAALKEMSR